jgi:hypothetical protein
VTRRLLAFNDSRCEFADESLQNPVEHENLLRKSEKQFRGSAKKNEPRNSRLWREVAAAVSVNNGFARRTRWLTIFLRKC